MMPGDKWFILFERRMGFFRYVNQPSSMALPGADPSTRGRGFMADSNLPDSAPLQASDTLGRRD